jgi:hypothetical protein
MLFHLGYGPAVEADKSAVGTIMEFQKIRRVMKSTPPLSP